MKIKRFGALLLSAVLCIGMAAPAFAYEGDSTPVEQPVLPEIVEEEDTVTITDEESGALTPEGNLTLVDDYYTNYSDGSGQQFITMVSKSGATFYLVIDRNAKGQQTVHFMNLVDETDLLALMDEDAADAYTAEKEAAAKAEQERKQAEEDAKKAAEEAAASGTEQPKMCIRDSHCPMRKQEVINRIGIQLCKVVVNFVGIFYLCNVFWRCKHTFAGENGSHLFQREGVLLDCQRRINRSDAVLTA